MSVVTFYSYKGGVGRSLALANVAVILARRGHRVLVIDWDLEAPGLEEYFTEFRVNADGRGLLFLLRDKGELDGHIWRMTGLDDNVSLDFLPSGRDEPDYYPALEAFDPDTFFAEGGGDFLEQMRAQWEARYDFVLIDSRTGLSDTGGICTILLPDIIVALFTATRQSYRGVRDVLTLAQRARQKLAYTRPMFSVLPIPCRLDPSASVDLHQWIEEFAESMAPLTRDWLPKTRPLSDVLHELRVDHVPRLSQGTKIVPDKPDWGEENAKRAFERIADLLEGDLQNVADLFPTPSLETPIDRVKPDAFAPPKVPNDDFLSDFFDAPKPVERLEAVDIYISVGGGSIESRWVEDLFLPSLIPMLAAEIGRQPRVFFDRHELSGGDRWSSKVETALQRSRVMLAFVTARSTRSDYTEVEQTTFVRHADPNRPVIPIRLSDSPLPDWLAMYAGLDFSRYFTTMEPERFWESELAEDFWRDISRLTKDLSKLLSEV